MYKCHKCGKRIRRGAFYCNSCKQKEIKKLKQRERINAKIREDSAVRKFNAYLKSGRRTY